LAPFATGLLSYLVPYSITTHPQIYWLPACHTTFLSLCLTLLFFYYLPTFYYLSFWWWAGLFLFCQFSDDVHSWSGDHPYYDLARFGDDKLWIINK
jgi:hypothetical protein